MTFAATWGFDLRSDIRHSGEAIQRIRQAVIEAKIALSSQALGKARYRFARRKEISFSEISLEIN